MVLYNRINGRQLKEFVRTHAQERTTISFYKYQSVPDPHEFRDELYRQFNLLEVWGRIYVAHEGINAQVSVPSKNLASFRQALDTFEWLRNVRLNLAVADDGKSFFKLKILVRKKIVADGLDDSSFDVTQCGVHVDAVEFNRLADDPNTVVVDMRNHYESEVGHFKNAILPNVDTFREELQVVEDLMNVHQDKNLLMYCTGGIRCEKASAWMKHRGFKNVFQLEGGIIHYTRQVNEQGIENKFIGKNFVFDERLGERITPDVIATCHQCGVPCDDHTNCKNEGCHLLFIQCPACADKFAGCCSADCQHITTLPMDEQRALRKGVNKGRQVFKKGRGKERLAKTSAPAQ
jgi:UPF0176 protein